jgi:hypothetical protein
MFTLLNGFLSLVFTLSIYVLCISLFLLGVSIFISNPFRKLTIVRSIFSTVLLKGQLMLLKSGSLKIKNNPLSKGFAWIKAGTHILKNAIIAAPRAQGTTVEEIIASIHRLRFNPSFPYIISGDHFSMLYPRNLGIFYYSILDPRVALNDQDWLNKERKYLQTTAYALEAFSRASRLSTTVVPVGMRSVSLINIFAYPSDTLYGILHALNVMISSRQFYDTYPFVSKRTYVLHTASASKELLQDYMVALKKLYKDYRKQVFDEKTGLIRQNLHLSSHLDTKIRSSSFYDNVIFWKTTQLAHNLDIIDVEETFLKDLKKRILETYWDEEHGYFLDDLSSETLEHHRYASDWVIVLTTSFLEPSKKTEREYYERTVEYIQKMELDKPFPLKVLGSYTKSKDHFWVRTFVSGYQDNAIWSNLGVQYIKVLCLLFLETGKKEYLKHAGAAVDAYRDNIFKYKGYPELYDSRGRMMQTFFYRSIRQTSWVVDFEHAQAIYNYCKSSK